MMQSLLRAQTILKQGFSGENKNDFINEFELYWAQLKDCRIAHLAVETDRKNRIVKGGIKKSSKRKKEKQIEYIKRCKKAPIYIGENVESLKRWNLEKTPVMNIAYFVIYSEKYIFPPDIRKKPVSYTHLDVYKRQGKEIANIMNNAIEGWKPHGTHRFGKEYGIQRSWKRMEDSVKKDKDGFMEVPEQLEIPFELSLIHIFTFRAEKRKIS